MLNIRQLFQVLKQYSQNNEIVRKTIENSSWLVGDKIFYMAIGIFVTAIVARYFGPENFGQFNYAMAFVSIFTAISTLGMETLTVKAIVDESYDEGTILCTSLFMRFCGGIILACIAITAIKIIEPNDKDLCLMVAIISFSTIIKSLEVIEYWVQAYQKAKISSIIRMSNYIVIAVLKTLLVIMGGTLITYTLIYVLDAAIIGFALIIAYFQMREKISAWKIDLKYAKSIISQSWYLILSGLMVTLYMRIDQVMLGSMLPDRFELGVYSAAVRVAEMWYFVPMAIITSFKPVILNNQLKDKISYIKSIQYLYTLIAWISISFGIFVLLFSKPIIYILYGADYLQAASILAISIWAGTFAMLGCVSSIWIICEGLQKYSMILVFCGAFINILLNIILIPLLGAYGAAIATLITQVMSNFIIPFFIKDIRLNSIMILDAFMISALRKK